MTIDLAGRVAIVTGAGGGLGRSHALLLAARGAKVTVNDLGGSLDGTGGSGSAAQDVANEIIAAGGEAIADRASVTDPDQVAAMVEAAQARWGRVDILVNNAGILRDKTFAKMTLEDFRAVIDVHLIGAAIATKAVWDLMREQKYGRIVMTTSSSGLWGSLGQANYSAAKMALVGLAQTLALEGRSSNIRVNALAPTAGTRMMENIVPPDVFAAMAPGLVSPGLLALVHDDAPTGAILCAGSGSFERAFISLTQGVHVGGTADAPEQIISRWDELSDRRGDMLLAEGGGEMSRHQLVKAGFLAGGSAG